MARANVTKTTAVGPYPTLQPAVNSLDVTMTAANVADKNEFVMSGDDLLLVQNTDPTNPYTFTISSIADDLKRTGDVGPYTLQAGDIAHFKFSQLKGWMQSGNKCYIEANNAAIKFGVLTL